MKSKITLLLFDVVYVLYFMQVIYTRIRNRSQRQNRYHDQKSIRNPTELFQGHQKSVYAIMNSGLNFDCVQCSFYQVGISSYQTSIFDHKMSHNFLEYKKEPSYHIIMCI